MASNSDRSNAVTASAAVSITYHSDTSVWDAGPTVRVTVRNAGGVRGAPGARPSSSPASRTAVCHGSSPGST